MLRRAHVWIAFASLSVLAPASHAVEREKVVGANWAQAKKFTKEFVDQHVHTASIAPVFIGKTDLFWYAIRTPEGVRYWKVDPAKKSKVPLFDHAKLLAQLSEQAQKPLDAVAFQIRTASVTETGPRVATSDARSVPRTYSITR